MESIAGRRLNRPKFILVLCVFFGSQTGFATLNGFVPATAVKEVKPNYPKDRYADSNETSVDDGLVEVLFMVNEQGEITAPTILRASMDKFIEPTLRALSTTKYKPATANGEPVASFMIKSYAFKLSAVDLRSARGSTSSFANVRDQGVPDGYQSFYDEFTEELQKHDADKSMLSDRLDRMIELKHQSFYSLAYHALARFRFAEKFQGPVEKIAALKDLVWYDPKVQKKYRMLKDDLENVVWSNLLKLQLETGQYADALATYDRVAKENPSLAEPFASYIEQITQLQQSDQFTQRVLTFDDSGVAVLPLLKRSFTFTEVAQDFSAMAVYCETKYAKLPFAKDSQYGLPTSWGECVLKITAEPNSTANLLQQ